MRKTYMIADLHFGHKNIIAYESRPFCSVAEMDSSLIENWNQTVNKEDIVYVLGDVSFLNQDKTKAIVGHLKGEKILILGNHDMSHSVSWWKEAGFRLVVPYPILFENWFLLSHEPLYINTGMPYANIFGHVHSNPAYHDYSAQTFCVSVERIGYKPILFDDIKQAMSGFARKNTEHSENDRKSET